MALRTSNLYESNHSLSSNINAGNVGVKVLQVVIEFKRIGEIGNSYIFSTTFENLRSWV
jgi:hypothetical protein